MRETDKAIISAILRGDDVYRQKRAEERAKKEEQQRREAEVQATHLQIIEKLATSWIPKQVERTRAEGKNVFAIPFGYGDVHPFDKCHPDLVLKKLREMYESKYIAFTYTSWFNVNQEELQRIDVHIKYAEPKESIVPAFDPYKTK